MVGPIVLAASAGLGMLAGIAAADRCSSSSGAGTNNLPLAGGAWPSCAACGGTGEVACLCARWSDGDVGCRPCAGPAARRAGDAAAPAAPAGGAHPCVWVWPSCVGRGLWWLLTRDK